MKRRSPYCSTKNLGGFHFSGIRIPAIIQAWVPGNDLPDVESFATEVAIFQEHLHERIVALAHDQGMVREMRSLNAKTRRFRECELRKPEAARDVLDKMAALVNALFNRNEELCSTILFQCTERRFELLVEIASAETPTKGPPTRSHVVPRHGAHIKRR
ncbi:FCD domain-containing protein [Agrobacterium fabrum]|uniref:FCD domain-containing protein n=1 Tax=Agrobacterium fabrum TaxID=1176649 RepID=UPI0021575BD6|nr:FCD domain-containing protein [Agrobacterium fabrum]MCR6727716.1 FCD domain-containing protein [Agrobacterium fabrum]